jgi:2,4-dienoyl-CoA reductase-like NADH-dependent reductase (Old Yellow Enzyme family)
MLQAAARSETREVSLFDPIRLGALILANRIVTPPVTCSRASSDGDGFWPFVVPRALEIDEIPGIIEQYCHAARCAKQAGLVGAEIQAANANLLDHVHPRQHRQA